MNDGAELLDVDSTGDELVLVLGGGRDTDRYRLDAEATRSLLATNLPDEMTKRRTDATPMIV